MPRKQTPREARAERMLHRIRSHPALYGDLGDAKEVQAIRIRDACKVRLADWFKHRHEEAEHARGQRLLYLWA